MYTTNKQLSITEYNVKSDNMLYWIFNNSLLQQTTKLFDFKRLRNILFP